MHGIYSDSLNMRQHNHRAGHIYRKFNRFSAEQDPLIQDLNIGELEKSINLSAFVICPKIVFASVLTNRAAIRNVQTCIARRQPPFLAFSYLNGALWGGWFQMQGECLTGTTCGWQTCGSMAMLQCSLGCGQFHTFSVVDPPTHVRPHWPCVVLPAAFNSYCILFRCTRIFSGLCKPR
jgi:hypothetical protein